MYQLLTSSYEQAVIDNEIFAASFRIAEGIPVTADTQAVDQIVKAGPGGQFLGSPAGRPGPSPSESPPGDASYAALHGPQ